VAHRPQAPAMTGWRSTCARWAREPLVQFLAIGALLFGLFDWWGGRGPGGTRIVVTPGQVETLVAGFIRTWHRPPTEPELKTLVDEHVREEVAAREATALGLDRDDAVVRRRLRQKLEFLAEDSLDATPPTDAELQAWLDAHPALFRREPRLTFRQVFLSPERRKASLEADARSLREHLAREGPDARIDTLGDSVMLEDEVRGAPRGDVARLFGDGFAEEILKVDPGRWAGPIRSGYGLHLVLVREREDGRLPALAEVRPQLEREVIADRRRRQIDAMYARLLERYRVVMDKRADPSRATNPTPPPPGPGR
jgi:PPIC-type PPIASE domain